MTDLSLVKTLILAAGSSSRMGQSKQLLAVEGEPLIRHTTKKIVRARLGETIVVLGSNEAEHRKVISDLPIHIISNSNWSKGLGTSIKTGVDYIEKNWPDTTAVIISVCDQPYLTLAHIQNLVKAYQKGSSGIIASAYGETKGVPALFDRAIFKKLKSLADSDGAKKLIEANEKDVSTIPFERGQVDLDTMGDYNTFISK